MPSTARRAPATGTAAPETVIHFLERSWVWLFLRKLDADLAIAVGIVAPVLAHLDEQEQMHRHAQNLRDLLARLGADRLDGGAALAEHDLALAFALDKDRLLDADRFVLAFGPALGLDSRLIGQLLMQLAVVFSPGDLGGEMPHWRVRHLVFGIVKRPRRHHRRQRPL